MEITRAKILINNILSEVSAHIEWQSEEEYILWLKTEIGFTENEINELKLQDLLPVPVFN